MGHKAIFIAATGQNVGKTTICLGLLAGLRKRFARVGFIKPVGQQHLEVEGGLKIDKDAVLFKEHFSLEAPYTDISPVILPSGFTRRYLRGEVERDTLRHRIRDSFHRITEDSDYTIVEGTGHVGVGSIVELNNACVAKDLDIEVVIIVSGGLGSAHDELALNIEMCRAYGVQVRGVILNRVRPDKRDMILEYFPKALKKFGVPLIGCVPFSKYLSTHSMEDFEWLFQSKLLAGQEYRYRHFRRTRLVAGSLESYLEEEVPNELVITPASRDDIIHAILDRYSEPLSGDGRLNVGLLLTGRQAPSKQTLQRIERGAIPTLYVPLCSYDAMKMLTSFIAKTRKEDERKVAKAIEIVESNIDFSLLCQTPFASAT